MGKIYQVVSKDGYEFCHPVNQDDFERINAEINGRPLQAKWKPIHMQLIRQNEGKILLASDSPWLGSHALIFRQRAIDVLGSLLGQYGELLPLDCEEAELSMFNVVRVVDGLDENASNVMRFSDGRVMMVTRYVFDPEVIEGVDIFKIPTLRVSPTFVSQRFCDLWRKAKLKGLDFRPL